MKKSYLFFLIAGIALAAAMAVTGIIFFSNNKDAGEAIEEQIAEISEDEIFLNEIAYVEEILLLDQNIVIAQPIQAETISLPFKYILIPESPRPGEPVTFAANVPIRYADLIVNGNRVSRARGFTVPAEDYNPSFNAAIFAVPSTVNPGNAVVRLTDTGGATWEIEITIANREFLSETLNITPTMSDIITSPDPQVQVQAERRWEIIATTNSQVYHWGAFMLPVTSTRRTSQYGARRINVYPDGRRTTDIHAGVDISSQVIGQVFLGEPVHACGRGRVMLSRAHIVPGNSIIIEHAPGVYSIYYHLDSFNVQEGEIVEAGALIGRAGSTGFSTGAHLHWEIRVGTENTDPDAFVARPLIDKNLIISRLFY